MQTRIKTTVRNDRPKNRVEFCRWAARQDVNHCIVWPFGKTQCGYCRVNFEGHKTTAHRIVLELAKGKPPTPKHVAAHSPVICHNRSCLNPNHLRWATTKENSDDRLLDGTANWTCRSGTGVSRTRNGKFRAYIYRRINRRQKQIHLGIFATKQAAQNAVAHAKGEV